MTLPLLPPAFTLITLDRERPALAHALAAAARGAADGTVYWTERADRLEAAFVLEPESAVDATLPAHLVLMTALGDALAALLPPGRPVGLHWPGRVSLDGATLGHVTWRLPPSGPGAVPPWLVQGVVIRLAGEPGLEPGDAPGRTSLDDEGAGDIGAADLLEALARYFLAWMHRWQEEGFAPVAQAWNARCPERGGEIAVARGDGEICGRLLGVDVAGRLRVGTARIGLLETPTPEGPP